MESQDWSPDDDFEYVEELRGRLEFINLSMAETQKVIHEVLHQMRQYLCWKTGLTPEELSPLLDRLEELAGPELSPTLSLDEIANWVTTLRSIDSV